MASSGNFSLWSPLFKNTTSNYNNLSKANTRFDGNTNNSTILTDFAIPVGTKFYAEMLIEIQTGIYAIWGIAPPTVTTNSYARTQSNIYGMELRTQSSSLWTVNSVSNTTIGSDSSDVGQTAKRVIGVAVNRVDDELKLYLDNTLKFTLSIPSTGEYHFFASHTGATGYTQTHHNFNGGHDSTGAGDFSAGGNADANGFGDFQYSPPSGHLACCSANLPISDAVDPAQTDDDYIGGKQFNVLTYTGNGGTNNITSLGFQPDLVWIKQRNGTAGHKFYDSTRGATKMIAPHNTDAEITVSTGLTSFDSDGFTLGSNSGSNGSSNTYVAWCWRANGGTTATNNEGATSNTLQANTAAGFSISQFSNSSGATTIGHGLGVAPAFYVIKIASGGGGSWGVYHKSIGATKYIRFNSNAAAATASNYFNDTEPTNLVLSVGSTWTGTTIMCYAWADVEGFQKFGSYTGNGNADGPFIYTGFRPRLLVLKRNATDNWFVFDSARDTFNVVGDYLLWDATQAESASSLIDFTSNGFKLRSSSASLNPSGGEILYMAWGDVPFKYNNTF
jgi:hypothetical protein